MGYDKPHIVHLIASGGMYGAEKWILALMRAMDATKYTSTLINLSDIRNESSAVVEAGKDRGLNAIDFYTGGTFNPLLIFHLAKWLKENKIDIVHGHGYKSDFIGLLASRVCGCKIITTPHGWSNESDTKLRFYEKLDRFVFRFMDYVCPLSTGLMKSVEYCVDPKKLKLIVNGVDIDEVSTQPVDKNSLKGCYNIGYVGQLIERKNLDTLIKALHLLSKHGEKFKCSIIGNGNSMHSLKQLTCDLGLKDSVEFFGYREDAISIMKSFDVFVLPSQLEGIPRCVMEAMACKVPVVVSDIPGNRDLVVDGITGLLFSYGSESQLATALIRLASDSELRASLAQNANQLIIEKYSNKRMAAEYSHVYSEQLRG